MNLASGRRPGHKVTQPRAHLIAQLFIFEFVNALGMERQNLTWQRKCFSMGLRDFRLLILLGRLYEFSFFDIIDAMLCGRHRINRRGFKSSLLSTARGFGKRSGGVAPGSPGSSIGDHELGLGSRYRQKTIRFVSMNTFETTARAEFNS